MQKQSWLALGLALAVVALPAASALGKPVDNLPKGLSGDGGLGTLAVNDNLASAIVVGGIPFTNAQDTTTATLEAGEPAASCGFNNGKSIWYTFTSPVTSSITIDTIGSNFDTVLDARTGAGFGANVACNDDTAGIGLRSRITFTAIAGTLYKVRVQGYFNSGGSSVINFPPPCVAPVNDNLASAIPLTSTTVNTTCATEEAGEEVPDCSFVAAPIGNSVWYSFSGASLPLTISTIGSGVGDTIVAVYAVAPDGSLIGENLGLFPDGTFYPGLAVGAVPCNDDDAASGTLWSQVVFVPVPGVNYVIQVGTWGGGAGGSITLIVS
jgi:hypothetical protein